MPLNEDQIERYSRQIILPEVGGRGQESLLRASLWISDAVEPLAAAARYLAAAGVGRISAGGDAGLARELALLNPAAEIEPGPDWNGADVALAGAASSVVDDAAYTIRGGAGDTSAWVACGGAAVPLCRRCRSLRPTPGGAFASAALGLAAAQMALAALTHLLSIESGLSRPAVTVFDIGRGTWTDGADGECAACGAERR